VDASGEGLGTTGGPRYRGDGAWWKGRMDFSVGTRRRLLLQASLLAVVALLGLLGCATVVEPPKQPTTPLAVFLVDYGRHASLLLPDSASGGLVEYAYGDWAWFALDESAWYDVFATLFWPTRGALGRRTLDVAPEVGALRRAIPCEALLPVFVEAEDARALLARLDADYQRHADSAHHQPLYRLDFVHAEASFHVFHGCSHQVASWLRELGCRVRGASLWATFEVCAVDEVLSD
jgi:hypothetical protein